MPDAPVEKRARGPPDGMGENHNKAAVAAAPPPPSPPPPPQPPSGSSDDAVHFPVEDIVQHPLPGYVAPASIMFSPDDRLVSYLYSPDATLSRKLFIFDPATGAQQLLVTPPPGGGVDEGNLSTAEKLRRERLRERGLGVTRYEWSKNMAAPRVLIPLPTGVFVQDGLGGEFRLRIPASPAAPILDPQLSPDGSMIAFVMDDELHVISASIGEPVQLTHGGKAQGKTRGLAEYIAQEEMERRLGFWWSQDSLLVAFAEVDASAVPPFRIVHQGKAAAGGTDVEEDHAYPFAGQANAVVRLGVVAPAAALAAAASCASGSPAAEPVWMDLQCGSGDEEHEYLARVTWLPGGGLVAQVQNRAQTRLLVLLFNAATGERRELFAEENATWVNLHDCFTPLQRGDFIWASERTGFRHLYVYGASGEPVRPLTAGCWMVEAVAGVDEAHGLVYFTATADGPLETHLYVVPLEPTSAAAAAPPPPRRLTNGAGRHSVVLDHAFVSFVDSHDSMDTSPCVRLCALDGGRVLAPIFEPPTPHPRVLRLQLRSPELQMSPKAGLDLFGALYRPDERVYGPPPWRTVVSVYGGPHVQTVCNSWISTVDMRAQFLRSRGFLVWKLDNRGSARRGLAFEGAIKHAMGTVDVEDQAFGVHWLIKSGLADPARIGIYGWSYGGYLAAMALAKLPGMFRCAVAGAPVTSWDGYDTHYTERYMGTPAANPAAYEAASVMRHVSAKMQGRLLLVHGMIDENVHFRHTARLVNALNGSGVKGYELLVFPDERHMPRSLRDRTYMEERIFEFLDRHLL
eukprot:SM000168S02582  [mRNA]  locus=s168:76880:80379:- [translate_table: standard]